MTSGISAVASGAAAVGTAIGTVAAAVAPFAIVAAVGYGIYKLCSDD